MSKTLLSIRGLQAHYGQTHALRDIDLDIDEGGMFAILGPSGSGKSTLLRVIAGFEPASGGELTLDGRDLLALPANRRGVGLMFQSYALFPHMSVAKNIAYGLEAEKLSRAEIKSRVAEAIEMIGLGHLADRRPAQLSGGQRQRVALARSIVKRPRLLLLDEPLSALDKQLRTGMQSELKRLQRETGMTFVIVTHDQEEAMSLADRVALLRDGTIEQLGTPTELYESPRSRFCAEFIGRSTLVEGAATEGGVELPGFGELALRAPRGSRPGERVLAVIRPEQAALVPASETGEDRPAVVRGTLESASYLGGAADAEVRVGSTLLTVRCANMPGAAPGAEVAVRLDTAAIRVIEA